MCNMIYTWDEDENDTSILCDNCADEWFDRVEAVRETNERCGECGC